MGGQPSPPGHCRPQQHSPSNLTVTPGYSWSIDTTSVCTNSNIQDEPDFPDRIEAGNNPQRASLLICSASRHLPILEESLLCGFWWEEASASHYQNLETTSYSCLYPLAARGLGSIKTTSIRCCYPDFDLKGESQRHKRD